MRLEDPVSLGAGLTANGGCRKFTTVPYVRHVALLWHNSNEFLLAVCCAKFKGQISSDGAEAILDETIISTTKKTKKRTMQRQQ